MLNCFSFIGSLVVLINRDISVNIIANVEVIERHRGFTVQKSFNFIIGMQYLIEIKFGAIICTKTVRCLTVKKPNLFVRACLLNKSPVNATYIIILFSLVRTV